MGGDSFYPPLPSTSTEEELSLDFPQGSINFSVSSGDEKGLGHKLENERGLNSGEFPDVGPRISLIDEAAERQKLKVYAEVLRSYEELQSRIDRLELAKIEILSYSPGSWAEKASGMDLSEYDVPIITSLLLIGPRGSGKSSLVNKISRALEDNILFTPVNFVIFVVNGLSVLESMDSVEEKKKQYCQMIATNFSCPSLSFKDDKPVVVVTHGDLLSLSDRVRVRVYLGELLGVPPTIQIFDIPENNDAATTSAIVDMLIYCLERADRNLPAKGLFVGKLLMAIMASRYFCGMFVPLDCSGNSHCVGNSWFSQSSASGSYCFVGYESGLA
ncbi:hypothetical protein DH2020_000585 [Rehmannia glutinosa]|uniref:P-loop containing nucleoside triphosphate hydrolases superfamily protein n=1 Tax=Rehmannia glutinosa TaxID=99300 RepID=A0ABR0XX79_REHGL